MALFSAVRRIYLPKTNKLLSEVPLISSQSIQNRKTQSWTPTYLPKPGKDNKCYRRIVHYDEEYTIKPLKISNIAGRDVITGRKICEGIGGGIKHKYHWINWYRRGPTDPNEPPKEEVVLDIFKDGCRTSFVALVGSGKDLYYILATENMKIGQVLKVSSAVPLMPVRAYEGDAYPLGALPIGTIINSVEKYAGKGSTLIHAAGSYATIVRKDDKTAGNVVILLPSKREFSLDKQCMATVGRLSNIEHSSIHIGSAQKLRELGYRPRSGLWHRKTGRFGRKLRRPPPLKRFYWGMKPNKNEYVLHHSAFNTNSDIVRKPGIGSDIPYKVPEINNW